MNFIAESGMVFFYVVCAVIGILVGYYFSPNRKQPAISKEQYYLSLLNKHGVCVDCGSMFSHDIDQPFADCSCHCAEWYTYTPYMLLEEKIYKAKNAPYPVLPEPVITGHPSQGELYTREQLLEFAAKTRAACLMPFNHVTIEGAPGPAGHNCGLSAEGQPGCPGAADLHEGEYK